MADTSTAVECEVRIAAGPETVFEFFVDPDKMTRWMGRWAELDARPGGLFRVDISGRSIASGEYVEVSRPHRVVFTWGWETGPAVEPGSSTVEVVLEPDGDGTLVRLIHSGLPDAALRASHGRGWDNYLPRLAIASTGGQPGPDPMAEG